jgi:hypothetical protein
MSINYLPCIKSSYKIHKVIRLPEEITLDDIPGFVRDSLKKGLLFVATIPTTPSSDDL